MGAAGARGRVAPNALITGEQVPDPDSIGVDYAAYLNGLGEAAGELRRYTLDMIRRGELERSEPTLQAIDDIYSMLVTMDFPDALTGGLRSPFLSNDGGHPRVSHGCLGGSVFCAAQGRRK